MLLSDSELDLDILIEVYFSTKQDQHQILEKILGSSQISSTTNLRMETILAWNLKEVPLSLRMVWCAIIKSKFAGLLSPITSLVIPSEGSS